jgi:hypothetical protein
VHLSLSQSRERVETYGVPSRLAGDQPLPALLARLRQQRGAVAGLLVGDPQRIRPVEHALQRSPALLQREPAHVAPVRHQDVEDVVEEHGALATAEPVAPADEGDRLAVDHEPVGGVLIQRGGDRRVAVVQGQLVARVQPRPPAVLDGQAADAVELALEHPALAGRAVGGEHGLHRGHERGSHPVRYSA